jgi:predicted nucleic acid-binding protein
MRYIDTSVIIAYLIREPASQIAEDFLRAPGSPLAVSTWTEVELMSALGIKLRTRQLSRSIAEGAVDRYVHLISPRLNHLRIENEDHRHAVSLIADWRTSLRAGDSLHLAIAAAHGATVYTFDRTMKNAGLALGIPTVLLQ